MTREFVILNRSADPEMRAARRPRALRAPRGIAALAGALLLFGCTGVPQPELESYVEAFNGAHAASAEIYGALRPAFESDRFDPPVQAAVAGRIADPGGEDLSTDVAALADGAATGDIPGDALAAASDGRAAYRVDQPRAFLASLGSGWAETVDGCTELADHPDLAIRCQAFEFAARYNQVIASLLADAPPADLKAELFSLSRFVSGPLKLLATAFAGPVTLPLGGLGSILERAIAASDEDDILRELEAGLPDIRTLVTLLERDVPLIYDIQRAHYEERLGGLFLRNIKPASSRVTLLYRVLAHRSSVGPAFLVGVRGRVAEAVSEISKNAEFGELRTLERMDRPPEPDERGFPPNALPERALAPTQAQLELQATAFEQLMEQFDGQVAAWRRFEESLQQYDAVLDELSEALRLLENRVTANTRANDFGFLSTLFNFGSPAYLDEQQLLDIAASVNARVVSIETLLRAPVPE